jgi:tetratricopeptide (TPR) repeat protein
LQINPNNAVARFNLGNTFYRTGKISEAMKEYELALQIDPNYGDARDNLTRLQALHPTP